MSNNQTVYILLFLMALVAILLLVACRGGDSGAAELSRLEKEIGEIEAEAGAITTNSCPLKIP
jgi:hypothetical protein